MNVDPTVMNAADNDLAQNWSFSTIVYDAAGNQKGTPSLQNDGVVSSCAPTLTLSGTNTSSGVIEAGISISSTEQISGGAVVDYSAGTNIDLNPDFQVLSGSEFHAYIQGCN